jgi:hypothetical protein
LDPDPATAEHDLAPHRSRPARDSLGIALPARPAERLAVLFHHRVQDLASRIDAELEEGVAVLARAPSSGSSSCSYTTIHEAPFR